MILCAQQISIEAETTPAHQLDASKADIPPRSPWFRNEFGHVLASLVVRKALESLIGFALSSAGTGLDSYCWVRDRSRENLFQTRKLKN